MGMTNDTGVFVDVGPAGLVGHLNATCDGAWTNPVRETLTGGAKEGVGAVIFPGQECGGQIPHNDVLNVRNSTVSAWYSLYFGKASTRIPLLLKDHSIELRLYRNYVQATVQYCKGDAEWPECTDADDDVASSKHGDAAVDGYLREEALVRPGAWTMVTVTYEYPGNLTVYLNGSVAGTAVAGGPQRGILRSSISKDDWLAHRFSYKLSHVKSDQNYAGAFSNLLLLSTSLSPSQVAAKYEAELADVYDTAGFAYPPAGLVGALDLGFHETPITDDNRFLFEGWLHPSTGDVDAQLRVHSTDPLVLALPPVQTALAELGEVSGLLYDLRLSSVEMHVSASDEGSDEAFRVGRNGSHLVLEGRSGPALLYAAHHVARQARVGASVDSGGEWQSPSTRWRVVNHWSFFRGFAEDAWMNDHHGEFSDGPRIASIFSWADLRDGNTARVTQWLRLLASVGINGLAPGDINWQFQNNMLDHLPELSVLCNLTRAHGLRVFWSPNALLAPNASVAAAIWGACPDFGGYLLKLGSEEQPGSPSPTAINPIASAVSEYNGTVLLRAFVYGTEYSGNRITDALDFFRKYDGEYADNVIVIGKYCPLDFETAEPINPLDGALNETQYGEEFMIAKGFPMSWLRRFAGWLGFASGYPRYAVNADQVVALVGDAMMGPAPSWTAMPLNLVNYYGYGRLAWNTSASVDAIHDEWLVQTYPNMTAGDRATFASSVLDPSESSARLLQLYHGYRGVWYKFQEDGSLEAEPLDGQHINATHIGDDNGDVLSSYQPPTAALYGNASSPVGEEVLLFFRVLPYYTRLTSGRTILEDIFYSLSQGHAAASAMASAFASFRSSIPFSPWNYTKASFDYYATHTAAQQVIAVKNAFSMINGSG
jgi:alpha-glucuronidase